jgi:hypothetical protein
MWATTSSAYQKQVVKRKKDINIFLGQDGSQDRMYNNVCISTHI